MHVSAFFLFFWYVCVYPNHWFYCYLVIIDVCSGQKEKLIKCYIIGLAVIFQAERKKEEMKRNKLLPDSFPSGIKTHSLVIKRSLRF